MQQRPFFFFFGLHLNLGAKFQNEIELLSLTKLRKNVSPLQNLLNQQKIDAYGVCPSVSGRTHTMKASKLFFHLSTCLETLQFFCKLKNISTNTMTSPFCEIDVCQFVYSSVSQPFCHRVPK